MSGQIIIQGLAADMPTPKAPRNPRIYIATDTLKMYLELGNNWLKFADVTAPVPPPVIAITNATSTNPDELVITGTVLDTVTRFRVMGTTPAFDTYYYDSAGPDTALNPATATVTVATDGLTVTIVDSTLTGQTIDDIEARDAADAVADQWTGSAVIA